MMWFQREEPGAAVGSCSMAGGFSGAEQGEAADGGGAEREKESSANQAFRRSGRILSYHTLSIVDVMPCMIESEHLFSVIFGPIMTPICCW